MAGEPAVRGNAQLLGPRSVHPGSVPMTPERVILSSEAKMRKIHKVVDRPPLTLAATLIGAQMPSTSAE